MCHQRGLPRRGHGVGLCQEGAFDWPAWAGIGGLFLRNTIRAFQYDKRGVPARSAQLLNSVCSGRRHRHRRPRNSS